jgi:O-antigen/teichoic acid export membrane protein
VDYLWGIETFGQFSLALSLVNFIMLFVSQVSMVLFPALRQTDNANLGRVFVVLRDGLDIFGPVALLLLTPVSILVAWWLPQYSATLEYFAVLLPICIFDGKMNLLGATYLKVLRQERALLKINVVSAIASSIAVLASAFIWHNIFLIMVSVCIVITARSLYTEWYVAKKIGITGSTIQYVPILTTFIYFVTSQLFPTVLSFVVVAAVYAFVLVYHRERIRTIFTSIRSGLLGR